MKEKSVIPVLVLVFVVLAVGIVAAGCLFYRSQQDSVRTQTERKLAAVVDLKASELSRWRKGRLADANVFYKNLAFSALVRNYTGQPRDLTLQEELRSWLGHVQANYQYDRIALFDAAGNTRMVVSDTDEPLSSITIQKARKAMRSGKLTVDDFYRNEHSRKIYLRLFVPILDGQDFKHPIGVVVFRIDPNTYIYPFVQRWPTPSKTAETLLVRREGNEVVFPNTLGFQKNTPLALRLPLDGRDVSAVKAALGQEGAIEGIDYRGVPVLAAMRAVPDSPWFLVAKINAAEVFAPMRERFWLMALLVGALLFGAAAILGLIWRRQQLGLYQEKYDAEREYRAILFDQTVELKTANKSLEESKRLAECATRAKSAFLANMSHEIRTPMTAILGFADVIHGEVMCCPVCPDNTHCKQRQNGCEAISTIHRNGEHLMAVIGDILDISKIEAGKLQIKPTRCSPVQLAADVISLLRVRADAKQLKLKTELAGPLPETVLTDPLRLRQVLVNLVGNAIKFTDQGEVRLAVRLISGSSKGTDPDQPSVGARSDENRDSSPVVPPRLRFDVTDTGISMNEEQVGKLFQPFSQVDNSSTRKFGGAGLGLAISKHLAKALGGNIEVHSTPGKGSTFSVTIDPGPLDGIRMVRGAREAVVQPPSTAAPAGAGKTTLHGRIFLAEDGLDNQRLISLFLKKAGAKVTAVENGRAAIEAALAAREASKPFDVILMDMQMPVMDGYEATRQLRSRGYRGTIIALTASAMNSDRLKCLEAGCDDYLSKPFERHDLLQIVARHMQASAPDGQRDSVVFDSVEPVGCVRDALQTSQ